MATKKTPKKRTKKYKPSSVLQHTMSSETVERKTFSYRKENPLLTLDFTLRTDVKSELKGYLELMEAGIVDIKKTLERLDNTPAEKKGKK